MTTSARTNNALLQSLQRARDRQGRISAQPSAETASLYSNPERKPVKLDERPAWNGGNVFRPTKTPKSVFLDNPSAMENGQAGRRTPSPRPLLRNNTPSAPTLVEPRASTITTATTRLAPPPPIATTSASNMPVYVQYSQPMYANNSRLVRTDPEMIVMESESNQSTCCDCFRKKNNYRKGYYSDREGLLNTPESPVYRGCQCCARGRLASACPSCYFCELFYGCPLYCWLLTFLLLLLPMLALFGWFLSEQPALNPAKRQYVTQQSSVVQNDVYAVMRNCAVPYCTNASPATTINALYLTYHDYAVTQVTSNANECIMSSLMLPLMMIVLKIATNLFPCD